MASASHRHYVGFPNYVLTYSLTHLLTYLQNADKVAFASTKLKPQKKEEALACMRDLEIEFDKIKKTEDAEKVGDEADALVERVDKETNPARSFLATQVKSSSSKQKESTEIEEYTSAQQGASDPNKQLECIRIPIFSGNKMEFQQWFAAFSTWSIKRHLRHNSKC